MQAITSSQQASNILGSSVNLLQTVAGRVQAFRTRNSVSNGIVFHTCPMRSTAREIFVHPAVAATLRGQYATPTTRPFNLQSPRTTRALLFKSTAHTHSFHTSHSRLPKVLERWQDHDVSHRRPTAPSPVFHRHLSLFRSQPLPPPRTLAEIHLLETAANASPGYIPAQTAYFQALLDSNHPTALKKIISRWERVLEFDQPNPVLRSDEAFQLYLTALVRSDTHASVDHAVSRRDQVLALPVTAQVTHAPEPVPAQPDTPPPATPTTGAPTAEAEAEASKPAEEPKPRLTASQQVAQAVLATRAANAGSSTTFLGGLLGKNKVLGKNEASAVNPLLAAGGGKENPVYVTLSEPKGATVYRIVRFLAFMTVSSIFILIMLSVLLENSGLMKAGPQKTAEFEPVEGKVVKFSDVHGVDEAKEELQEVVDFLKDPENFSTLGGKLPKGVLLTGPPGTGKTMLARAVAGEAGVPFLFASGSEFDEMFVGVGAKRIRDLFAAARKKQPSIIFIDELDAIGSKRSPKDQHYLKQTLNQLLVELDGFQQSEGVIVIAATNFPQSLDQALVRPGRFDRKINVPLPDVKGRVQILIHHMKNVTTSDEVDPAVLARGTPGFSGADLQNMVNQAAVKASREGYKFVLPKHFEWAKDRIIMGVERRSQYIKPEAKKLTAYHEGGHALVALYTDGAMPLHKVTCMPRGDTLGHTALLPEDDRYSISYKEYIASMDVYMGGRVAEELIYGPENVTSGCSSDLQGATGIASRMVKYWGYSSKLGPVVFDDDYPISSEKRKEIESEVRGLLDASQERAKRILTEREVELHRLAEALVEHETLDMEEVKKVIKGEKIRVNESLEQVVVQAEKKEYEEAEYSN